MPHVTKDAEGVLLHEFNHSLQTEALVDAALRRTFGESIHVDYTKMRDAQKLGFDYLLKWASDGGQHIVAVDDKADKRLLQTGNLSIELFGVSPFRGLADGWAIYGKAYALRYVCVGSGEVLVLPMQELRDFFLPRLEQFPTVGVVNRRGETLSHVSFNILVPATEALKHCPSACVVLLDGAKPAISKGFEKRVLSAEAALAALAALAGKEKYSKAAPSLSTQQIQHQLLANRFRHAQEQYLAQCRLPRGVHLQMELAA